MMHKTVHLILIALAIDSRNRSTYTLVNSDQQFPSIIAENNPLTEVSHVFERITGCQAKVPPDYVGWVGLTLSDVWIYDEDVFIAYAVMIPQIDLIDNNFSWCPIESLTREQLNIIHTAMRAV